MRNLRIPQVFTLIPQKGHLRVTNKRKSTYKNLVSA